MTELMRVERGFALLDGAAEMGRTGLVLNRDLSFDEWTDLGVGLQRVESGMQWALGDWLNYGEAEYGEKYAQAVEDTGYTYQSLANFAYVSSRITFSRRRENLSFGHHSEVAALEPDEQDKVLTAASDGHWSRQATREAVRAFKAQLAGVKPGPEPVRELPVKVTITDSNPVIDADAAKYGDAADFQPDIDPVAEWEKETKENERLREELERLTVDDKDKEIRKLSALLAQLNANHNGTLNTLKAAREEAEYAKKRLKDVRKALGVENDRQIVEAIAALQRRVA